MAGMKECFEVLSKGVIVSNNSDKFFEVANFLNIEDNFEEFSDVVEKLGFKVIGESGYFYLTKETQEVESFVNNHKKAIISISILKQIYPLISPNFSLKQTDFIVDFDKKRDENLENRLKFITTNSDFKSMVEEFFKLLERFFIVEKIDKDSYKVLNSINYYIKIVESVG